MINVEGGVDLDFVASQLKELGYGDIPRDVLGEFAEQLKKDPELFGKRIETNIPKQNFKKEDPVMEEEEPEFGVPRVPMDLEGRDKQTSYYRLKPKNRLRVSQQSPLKNFEPPKYDKPLMVNSSPNKKRRRKPKKKRLRFTRDDMEFLDRRRQRVSQPTISRRPMTARASTKRRSPIVSKRLHTRHNKKYRSKIRNKTWLTSPRYRKKCDPVNRYHQLQSDWSSDKFLKGQKTSRKRMRYQVRQEMLEIENRKKGWV